MTLYLLQGLQQRFHGKTVLDIEHLAIEAGCIHALLGPNGAGKTTLLNILAFLELPATGAIVFQGKTVDPARTDMLSLRRRVVLVDQHPVMFSTSVGNNIDFGLKIRKIETKKRQRIVDEVLATVGLERYKEARAHELSGGETQRLALARALALNPEVLLCDEPTASVDTENQVIIHEVLRRINTERGASIIFTTHDRPLATTLAHHTLTLANGRLADSASETPDSYTNGHGAIGPENIRLLSPDESCPANHARRHGRVVMLMEEGANIRMVVDAGGVMAVLIPSGDYLNNPPRLGGEVTLAIPEKPRRAKDYPGA
jgi:tungstate transport system ATP-binding protein